MPFQTIWPVLAASGPKLMNVPGTKPLFCSDRSTKLMVTPDTTGTLAGCQLKVTLAVGPAQMTLGTPSTAGGTGLKGPGTGPGAEPQMMLMLVEAAVPRAITVIVTGPLKFGGGAV